jgi:hypothetical protein
VLRDGATGRKLRGVSKARRASIKHYAPNPAEVEREFVAETKRALSSRAPPSEQAKGLSRAAKLALAFAVAAASGAVLYHTHPATREAMRKLAERIGIVKAQATGPLTERKLTDAQYFIETVTDTVMLGLGAIAIPIAYQGLRKHQNRRRVHNYMMRKLYY